MISIHEAATNGRLDEIKSLVQNGANVFAKSKEYGEFPMHLSALNGHTDCVAYFLDQGVDVNASNDIGLTCAHHAAYRNHLETLKLLTNNGANIEARCVKYGHRPIDGAAQRGHFECVEHLGGSNLNLLSLEGYSALHNAATGGHLKIIRFLVEQEADLEIQDNKYGDHPIHSAASGGHEDCVEYFLDMGINVDLPNKNGVTAIMKAASRGHLNIIKFLVKRRADFEVQDNKYGDRLIHSAASGGHEDCVEYFLDLGFYEDLPNKKGVTPIMKAASRGHLNTIKFLVKRRADFEVQDNQYGDRLIHSAASGGHKDCVEYFLDMGFYVDLPNKNGVTPIMKAAYSGYLSFIKFLVERGANLDVQDNKYGNHPIHSAAMGGHEDCMEYFLDLGIDVNLPDKNGYTPIMKAASSGHLNIIKFLVERGADLDAQDCISGNHSIHCAALGGHEDCLEYFLDLGYDVNMPNQEGFTPIIKAASRAHLNIIKFLVERGADLDVQDNKHCDSLIHTAAFKGHDECVEYFLDKGINVDLPNKKGFTPIMKAASRGHLNIIKLLVKRGADLDMHDKYGDRPIHIAAFEGHVDCMEFFLDLGIDVDLPNKNGYTPIMKAAYQGHLKMIRFLIFHGAHTGLAPLHIASRFGHDECVKFLIHHRASTEIRSKFNQTKSIRFKIDRHSYPHE